MWSLCAKVQGKDSAHQPIILPNMVLVVNLEANITTTTKLL